MAESKQNEPLLSAYLIIGEDELKRETVLKRLKARMEAQGDMTFNSDIFNGEQALGTDIVSACNTLPFASDVRLVQVDQVEKLKKEDSEALVGYLQSPAPSTVLALVGEKLAKNTRLYKSVAAISKKSIIECAPKKRYELVRAVRSIAHGHGVEMTEGSAQKLIELVGENTVRLDAEVQKIALAHRGTDAVNEHEVVELVSRTAEVKPWEFVDAFASRNTSKCILYLSRMESTSPHALLAMCVNRIRELICAKSLRARGCPQELARTLKTPDWRVKNHVTWSQNFSSAELTYALISARNVEQEMKSGSNPQAAFLDWILSVTKPAK